MLARARLPFEAQVDRKALPRLLTLLLLVLNFSGSARAKVSAAARQLPLPLLGYVGFSIEA